MKQKFEDLAWKIFTSEKINKRLIATMLVLSAAFFGNIIYQLIF
ncbi:MAG: hypothetical protein ACK5KP_04485 [Paludibacteraceae bacterium]